MMNQESMHRTAGIMINAVEVVLNDAFLADAIPAYQVTKLALEAYKLKDAARVEELEQLRDKITKLKTQVEELKTELAEENAVVDPRKDFWDGAGRYWVHVGGGKYVFSTHPDGKITPADHVDFADIVRAYGYKPLADRLIASRLGIDLDAKNLPRVWGKIIRPKVVTKVRDCDGIVWSFNRDLEIWECEEDISKYWGELLEDCGPVAEVLEGGDGDE